MVLFYGCAGKILYSYKGAAFKIVAHECSAIVERPSGDWPKLQFLYFLLAAAAFRIKAAPLVASSSESNPNTAEYFLPNLGHNEIHVDPCIGDGLKDPMAQAGSVVALNQQSR